MIKKKEKGKKKKKKNLSSRAKIGEWLWDNVINYLYDEDVLFFILNKLDLTVFVVETKW